MRVSGRPQRRLDGPQQRPLRRGRAEQKDWRGHVQHALVPARPSSGDRHPLAQPQPVHYYSTLVRIGRRSIPTTVVSSKRRMRRLFLMHCWCPEFLQGYEIFLNLKTF